jgi:ribose-phosphate pyrophosphokinase
MNGKKHMQLIPCTSNPPLAAAISGYLDSPLTDVNLRRFADQEIFIEVLGSVRGRDAFVIQSTSYPANDHLMELLIMIDALKRGSARRITAVMPYFGYARQDRKTHPRSPISAKLVADLITTAGADRVLTLDLHAGQIQGFFDIPVDNLFAGTPVFVPYIQALKGKNPIAICSPDVGGVVRARAFAKKMDAGLAIIDKRREKAGVSEVMNVIGEVKGHDCVLIDDMVDSAGTICNAAVALMDNGAASVRAVATHGVLSGNAVERIEKSPLSEMIISDSILATDKAKVCKKIKYLSIAPLIGEAIRRISEERAVSPLFENLPSEA